MSLTPVHDLSKCFVPLAVWTLFCHPLLLSLTKCHWLQNYAQNRLYSTDPLPSNPCCLAFWSTFKTVLFVQVAKEKIWQRWIIKPHYKTSCYHQLFSHPPKNSDLHSFCFISQANGVQRPFDSRLPANTQHASFFQVMNNNLSS